MEYQGVTLCYLSKFNIFSAPNFVTQHLSISQIINWYFSKSVTYSLEDYNSLQVMYINQVNGRKPFGQKYKYNQINSEDNCFDIDPKGPDLFLPGVILHQGIRYNTTITLPFIVHSGNNDKIHTRHTKKYKTTKKYLFQGARWKDYNSLNSKNYYVNCPHIIEDKLKELKNQFAVPFAVEILENNIWFAWIPYNAVIDLVSSGSRSISDHNNFLRRNAVYIDYYKEISMNKKKHGICEITPVNIWISKSNSNMPPCSISELSRSGQNYFLASSWKVISDKINVTQLKLFSKSVDNVYGSTGGFGSRHRSKCLGKNIYAGTRAMKCVRMSPRMGKSIVKECQFFRQNWNVNSIPLIQKTINELTTNAMRHRYRMDAFHEVLVTMYHKYNLPSYRSQKCDYRGFCRVSILTCGDKKLMGFCNGYHKDKNDTLQRSFIKLLQSKIQLDINDIYKKEKKDQIQFHNLLDNTLYAQEYLDKFSLGVSTTCGYKFINHSEENLMNECTHVYAYFLLNDYDIAFKIEDNLYHNFKAYIFGHQTSLPIVVNKKTVHYKINGFEILAWGAGGRRN